MHYQPLCFYSSTGIEQLAVYFLRIRLHQQRECVQGTRLAWASQHAKTVFICRGLWMEVGQSWLEGDRLRITAVPGLALGGRGACPAPVCPLPSPPWGVGRDSGCHQRRQTQVLGAFLACSEPLRSPAHRGSRQHFAAKEAAQVACPRPPSCWRPGGSTGGHGAFPSAALTSPRHFRRLRGIRHLFTAEPNDSSSPTLAKNFSFGNTFEN